MIFGERRGRAVGVAASLLLHGAVVVAFAARPAERLVVTPAAERVVEVTVWAGDEGRAAGVAPAQAVDAPPAAAPPLSGETASSGPDHEAVDAVEPPVVSTPSQTASLPAAATAEHRPPHQEREARRGRPTPQPRSSERKAAVVGETAPPHAASAAGRPGASATSPGGGATSDLAAYLARVRARIAARQSPQGGEEGRVGIRFDVADDGSFSGLAVVSGDHGPLADAALRIVRRASPAPPIPPTLGRGSIAMNVTIVFE